VSSGGVLQWKRACQVIIGNGSTGDGLSVEQPLRISFKITKTIGRTPNTCLLKLYNLSQDSEDRIKGEFDEVLINAGYAGHAALIFRGNIRHNVSYREGNDRIIEIDAGDGDKDFNQTIVNTTLAAGTSTSDLIAHVLGNFTSTIRGQIVVKDKTRIRGRVISGMARDVLDDVARENTANWSIQDGKLHMIPTDSTLPTEAIVLTSETGLLGAPEVSDKGITTRCLLNPQIAVNGKVWLNNNSVKLRVRQQKLALPGAHKPMKKHAPHEIARLDPDGVYKVFAIIHEGDTRGTKWETESHCVALSRVISAHNDAAVRREQLSVFLATLSAAGITQAMIEGYLGHPVPPLSEDEAGKLTKIATIMKSSKVSFQAASILAL
jgi:hypothetical protein